MILIVVGKYILQKFDQYNENINCQLHTHVITIYDKMYNDKNVNIL